MLGDAFRDWATGPGGLNEASARSYLSYLDGIERHLRTDLAADYAAGRLDTTAARLAAAGDIDGKTRANWQSALRKYAEFRSLTSA